VRDAEFRVAWGQVEVYLAAFPSDSMLFQCGTDSLGGDPITHLQLTETSHAYAARRLCAIADAQGQGRVQGMGGRGYSGRNLDRGWSAVVRAFLESVA
jgi:acetoin utilization protein AcuC